MYNIDIAALPFTCQGVVYVFIITMYANLNDENLAQI